MSKRTRAMVAEALECLGGNGYVEESGLPRLLRESPLNSIWEGSGNVQALDVLRALEREPEALDAFLQEVGKARGADHRLDARHQGPAGALADLEGIEARARRVVERMALVPAGVAAGALRPRRSPTRSAPAGWARRTAERSVRCRAAT